MISKKTLGDYNMQSKLGNNMSLETHIPASLFSLGDIIYYHGYLH